MMTTSNNEDGLEDIFADTETGGTDGTQQSELRPIPAVEEASEPPSETEPLSNDEQSFDYSPHVLSPEEIIASEPSQESNQPQEYIAQNQASTNLPTASRRQFNWRIVIIIVMAFAGAMIIGGIVWGSYYWYTHRSDDTIETGISDVNISNINEPNIVNTNVPANINFDIPPDNNVNTNVSTTTNFVDSDHDGLSDEEEKAVNTNPLKKDTDEDGLSDREEVRVYLTDPRNPDTDGDGYSDGDEVANFFHPNDPDSTKRLFDIPTSN